MDRRGYDAIVGLLQTKKNIILQGAPGVGKTYAAKRLAYSMMGVKDVSRVKLVQFHQSYSYEDFIEGYRPSGAGFELVKVASTPSVRRPPTIRITTTSSSSTRSTVATSPRSSASCSCSLRAISVGINSSSSTPANCSAFLLTFTLSA